MELKKIEGFTPGPWKVTTGIHSETTDSYDSGDVWFNINGEDHNVIGETLYGRCLDATEEEARANAELMAYAPELYQLAGRYRDECDRLRQGLVECLQMMEQTMAYRNANGITAGNTFLQSTIDKAKKLLNP